MVAVPPLLAVAGLAALAALCLASAAAQPSQAVCNTSTAGLPTFAAGLGLWNLTQWNTTNQFSADPDAGIAIAQVTFTSMFGFAFPPGSLVMWGGNGQVLASSVTEANQPLLQYWRSLSLSAGGGYQAGVGNAQCAHRNQYLRLYVLGDSYNGAFQSNASYVFATSNEYNFSSILSPATQAAWSAANRQLAYGGCVVDMQDRVYSLGDSDVWQSLDNGTTWTNVTTSSLYTPRQAFGYKIFTGTSGDVMLVLGGASLAGGALNDVWASQTGATSWVRQSASAPWSPRVGPNVAISFSGVLVLHGGAATFPVSSAATLYTDAWISLDIGATWQLLIADTGVARALAPTVFDSSGYLYVFSGYSYSGASSVGWRSNYALNNVQQWGAGSTATALTFPSNFSPCTAYANLSSTQPPTARSSSSAAASPASSSSAAAAASASSAVSLAASSPAVAASSGVRAPSAVTSAAAVGSSSPVAATSTIATTSMISPTSTVSVTSTASPTSTPATAAATTIANPTSLPPSLTLAPQPGNAAVGARSGTGFVLFVVAAATALVVL